MHRAPSLRGSRARPAVGARLATLAWVLATVALFYEYLLSSAPAVMVPQLSGAFSLDAAGVVALLGLFYYGYSAFSLVAGAAADRFGARRLLPVGAAVIGSGALLFATADSALAGIGRFLQGVGGAFVLVGAIDIAARSFKATRTATFIGVTQMFGMAGGAAAQLAVPSLTAQGLISIYFWSAMGVAGLVLAAFIQVLVPKEKRGPVPSGWSKSAARAFGAVFRKPQSILCGLIAGLLFLPATLFELGSRVGSPQGAAGLDQGTAAWLSPAVLLGWILGAPLLGLISDRIGRRKPVILGGATLLLACAAWTLRGPADAFPPSLLGLIMGVSSGAAMLPYTVIREANPPEYGGTATGVVNFLSMSFTAALGVAAARMVQHPGSGVVLADSHRKAFMLLLYGAGLAAICTLFLKETGPLAPRQRIPGMTRRVPT
jgi:MFS family permease